MKNIKIKFFLVCLFLQIFFIKNINCCSKKRIIISTCDQTKKICDSYNFRLNNNNSNNNTNTNIDDYKIINYYIYNLFNLINSFIKKYV